MTTMDLTRLAEMDWPWKSEDPSIHIILISDEQFVNMANHQDEPVEKMYPWADAPISLRQYCREGAAKGATTLRLAYDYFFGGTERSLYPDTEAFQETLKKVHDVAREFGIGLEPSVLSPLELGVGFQAKTGESGRWMHYREGLRDPETGQYSVSMWQQTQWCNNKGPTPLKLVGARAFAFREERLPQSPFFAVSPDEIVELAPPIVEALPGSVRETGGKLKTVRVRVWGEGEGDVGPLDRVLVVLIYQTVEMDYLSPTAAIFLDELVDEYHDRDISLVGIYSDEMHIQQDWSYHAHMDNGQFAVRYVSPGLERAFSDRYGEQYADLGKYMVYFCSHQHDFAPTHEPKLPSQHVFGASVEDVYETLRFRRDYYDLLEHSVVDLMIDAREKLERQNGREMNAFYHATWAESPTCDAWAIGGVHESWGAEEHRRKYEYAPDFLWSNTVHQAASACANYFAWNEFLTGGNDDTPEGGYADRNYYGRTLACSLAALNRRPLPSAGMWGMPAPVFERMLAVSHVFGALGHSAYRSVEDYRGRSIEALFLYPQDLVSVDERFGSWMVQYGYANLITAEKLVEYGSVTEEGLLAVKDARYRVVCALYEPFPDEDLLALLTEFVDHGGTVVWSSTPPMAASVREQWLEELFGVRVEPTSDPLGLAMPARMVEFHGVLSKVASMSVLSDLVVDRVFPLEPLAGTETVAEMRTGGSKRICVGTCKAHASGGQAIYLGFRPRDDQAASTGVEARAWFEILNALGAYPPSGAFSENDNPTVISRTTELLACAFPNGAVGVCPHYRHHEESWPGGFFRDEELDAQIMEANPVPDDEIDLQTFHVAGQTVTYHGSHAVVWRCDDAGHLIAFSGRECTGIELNGQSYIWADEPTHIAWHPLPPEQATTSYLPLHRVWCGGEGRVRIPLDLQDSDGLELWVGALQPGNLRHRRREAHGRVGYGERTVPFDIVEGALEVDIDEDLTEHWLYLVRRK
ncbi:MAG: hypothetical protein ACP5HS_10775 [Anaerolineae bacterium]